MKNKSLFWFVVICWAIIIFTSCKKEKTAQPKNEQPPIEQDAALIGTWASDSSRMDGGSVSIKTGDSLYVSSAKFKKVTYIGLSKIVDNNEWKTVGDSLLLSSAGYDGNHYKYSIAGSTLMLYLNSQVSSDIKYYFHKQ